MTTRTIVIADDFSRYPAGRYKEHGSATGQQFRETLLVPALREYDTVVVDMNGTMGPGSSFLEEAFGGLIREAGFQYTDLKKRLEIVSRRKSVIESIQNYLMKAAQQKSEVA